MIMKEIWFKPSIMSPLSGSTPFITIRFYQHVAALQLISTSFAKAHRADIMVKVSIPWFEQAAE
jgi:hypothetical protein